MAIALAMIFHCHWSIRPNLGNESLITNAHLSKLISWTNVSTAEILTNTIHLSQCRFAYRAWSITRDWFARLFTLLIPKSNKESSKKIASPWNKNILLVSFFGKTFYVCILCKYLADFNMHDVDSAQGCTVGSNI